MYPSVQQPILNAGNLAWEEACMRVAATEGCDVQVSGLQGNATVSWSGHPSLTDPATYLAAFRAGQRPARRLIHRAMRAAAPDRLVRAAIPRIMWEEARHASLRPDHPAIDLVSRPFEERAILPHFLAHKIEKAGVRYWRFVAAVDNGLYDRAGMIRWGMEIRDPFAQTAIANLCLSMPDPLFRTGDTPRALARALMHPRLPEKVRKDGYMAIQGADWRVAAMAQLDEAHALCRWAREDGRYRELFDLPALEANIATIAEGRWRSVDHLATAARRVFTPLSALSFARWVDAQ